MAKQLFVGHGGVVLISLRLESAGIGVAHPDELALNGQRSQSGPQSPAKPSMCSPRFPARSFRSDIHDEINTDVCCVLHSVFCVLHYQHQ